MCRVLPCTRARKPASGAGAVLASRLQRSPGMRVIEDDGGRTRFQAEGYGWSLAVLCAGALGMCLVALAGCGGFR